MVNVEIAVNNPRVPQCPACGSLWSVFLGALGRVQWFRCRACGVDHRKGGK